jgi:DNA-binding GntR family transcriptional regulator
MKVATDLGRLPRLTGGSLPDAIHAALRDAITIGGLAPGERLRQLDLARHFGTSQAPVREALVRLANEGLVVLSPNRGATVVQLSADEVEQVYSLRAELESWAVHRFLRCAAPAQLHELGGAIEAMQTAAVHNDQVAFVDADRRFHRTLCEGSASELLVELWKHVDSRARGMMSVANALYERGLADVAAMHPPILDALKQRDADRAEALIRNHMHRVWDEIARNLSQGTPTASSQDLQAYRTQPAANEPPASVNDQRRG